MNRVVYLLVPLVLTLSGCGGDKDKDKAARAKAKAAAPKPRQTRAPEEQMNAAHVLIHFQGSFEAGPNALPRREALKLAKEVAKKARDGADFGELAREYSDDDTASAGGNIGNFYPSQLKQKQFCDALAALKIGETSEPVESPLGYHIIRRQEIAEVYNASHILVLHKDSKPEPQGLERTREEALARAREILDKVRDGEPFNKLAVEYSEGPARANGGQMGNFTLAQLPGYFSEVGRIAKTLEIDEISEPFETEVGVHLVRRQEVPRPPRVFSAKHILIQYRGAERAVVTRSKEAALEIIQRVQKKLKAGEDFEELARDYSDGPSAPNGGDLGSFSENRMVPVFSKATAECKVGGYTDIVESQFGFHIIYRYK